MPWCLVSRQVSHSVCLWVVACVLSFVSWFLRWFAFSFGGARWCCVSVVQHSRYARGCVFGWLDAFMVRHFEISLFLGIATRSFCICILHLRVLLFILRQAAWVVRRVRCESRSQCFSFLLVLVPLHISGSVYYLASWSVHSCGTFLFSWMFVVNACPAFGCLCSCSVGFICCVCLFACNRSASPPGGNQVDGLPPALGGVFGVDPSM